MSGTETALSKAIRAALTARGARVIRIQSGIVPALYGATKRFIHCAESGSPDLCVIRPAKSFDHAAGVTFLEVKTKTGKLTPQQALWFAWAETAGVSCAVVRSISEAVHAVFESEARS